jgi:hypothetical protein
MPYTQNCSIFAAVGEAGINTVIQDLMAQRPALFNYGTSYFNPPTVPMCNPIPAVGDVTKYHNPPFTLIQVPTLGPLPSNSLDICAQITTLKIDFSPFNTVTLPAGMAADVQPQQFALEATLSVGLLCANPSPAHLDCFSLTFYAIGQVGITGNTSSQVLSAKVDDVEMTGINPQGLQDSINCIVMDLINHQILPNLTFAIQTVVLNLSNLLNTTSPSATVSIYAIPQLAGSAIPNNPALQTDQIQIFVEVQ